MASKHTRFKERVETRNEKRNDMTRKGKIAFSEETNGNTGTNPMARSTLRPYIMVTLIHAEIRIIKKTEIIQRITQLFECKAVVLATEKHEEKGTHYHIGIWANDASKNTVRSKIRKEFPEWEGRSIDISLHKGWGSICKYILKEDKEPIIWGEFDLKQIQSIAWAQENHKEAYSQINNVAILKRLEQIEDWYQIYREEIFQNKILSALPRMREAFEDLKTLKDIETNVLERIIQYLEKKGEVKEYDVEELREKYLVIDWIACQLCFKRPIKTKQLFIYGEPSTQKTLLLHFLAKVLKVYFASARRNDFAGANDYYDLWTFDEFHEHSEQSPYGGEIVGSTEEGSSFVNNLLKVLDGQECRLDSKYSKVFKKKRNVPIIMIANKLPQIMARHGPFRARFYRIRFSTQIQELKEERVIATLYGCILRRAMKSPYYQKSVTPEEVTLLYNKTNAIILPEEQQKEAFLKKIKEWKEVLNKIENPIVEKKQSKEIAFLMENKAILLTSYGKVYQMKTIEVKVKEYPIIVFEIINIDGEECQNWGEHEDQIDLLKFVNIPIRKKILEQEEKANPLQILFEEKQEKEREDKNQEIQRDNEKKDETIKRIQNIFIDKKEREWIRRKSTNTYIQRGQTQNEEVWSVITVQRNKKEEINDYAMWPIEIKIQGEKQKENEDLKVKVFPAIIRNISIGTEEEQSIRKKYQEIRHLVFNTIEETREQSIKCEIAIARNAEQQPWNLEC